jgi:hypothetical protein
MRNRTWRLIALTLPLLLGLLAPGPAAACGGFFCTTIPVDQAAERVIFAVDDGQITTYVQINYVGSPDNFAWVLPVPNVPKLAPGDMATFSDLDRMTSPLFIPPPTPDCLRRPIPLAAPAAASGAGVQVLDSGAVGPFDYVVVTSPDPAEMVRWLRDNGYQIDPSMEPLVQAYTDEGMVFLAMKLQPGKGTNDITPIRLTYDAVQPMIPLRLTAVAAQPNMAILTYIFAKGRTGPVNFVDMSISDGEILFSPFGGNNYRQVVSNAADQAGGRAFVTEFAGPTSQLRPTDPAAQALALKYPYLTRFYTRISPDEMTVDPVFDAAPGKSDISNIHDLSGYPSPFNCDDPPGVQKPVGGAGLPPPLAGLRREVERTLASGGPRGLLLATLLVGMMAVALRARQPAGRPDPRRGWLPPVSAQAGRLLLLEALLFQGLHELEHIVQVIQRNVLGIKNGAGLFGSVFDLEPVHFAYNLTFLILLGLAAVGLRQRGAVPRRQALVLALLSLTLVGQSYHTVEHVVKMAQFLETGRNGTPGILGEWIPVVWLHFWINTALLVPVVAVFFAGGFGAALRRDLARWLARRRPGRLTGPSGQIA